MARLEDVVDEACIGMIVDSAIMKNFVLLPEHINRAFVEFVLQYDLYVTFFNESGRARSLVVRYVPKGGGFLRGNSVLVKDSATAMMLQAACCAAEIFSFD
jgi:hypothetical protein